MERTIDDCKAMIKGFFENIGMDADDQRLTEDHSLRWCAVRGSAQFLIEILEYQDGTTVRVFSPILFLPDENLLPFYRRLLEINMDLVGCALGVYEDKVAVLSERPTTGLDPIELERMIHFVAGVADDLDNQLADEFRAPLFSERSD